jgi:hypothetical protein
MLDAFRIPAAQIALGSMFGGSVKGNHAVGAAHHAMTAQLAVLHIDLHRTRLPVSLDEVMWAGIQANPALKTDQRRVNGGFTAQNVNHRPINVDHAFPLERTPHLAPATSCAPIRNSNQYFEHNLSSLLIGFLLKETHKSTSHPR